MRSRIVFRPLNFQECLSSEARIYYKKLTKGKVKQEMCNDLCIHDPNVTSLNLANLWGLGSEGRLVSSEICVPILFHMFTVVYQT